MKENILFAIFLIFFLIIIAVIISMFTSLAKQGDERRDMIVGKASAKTFAIIALYMAFYVIKSLYLILSGTDLSPEGMNPFITLTTMAFIYAVELVYHRKKYGN